MRFFFDRNMPLRIARMVDVFETENVVRHHDDDGRFHEQTTDIEWLDTLRQDEEPWVIVSGDGRILKNKAEAQQLRQTGFTFFCLAKQWMHMNFRTEYAWKFLRVWPQIVENAELSKHRVFEVSGGSALKVEPKHF